MKAVLGYRTIAGRRGVSALAALVLVALLPPAARGAEDAAPQASQEPAATFFGEANVSLIELTVDVRDAEGHVPQDLGPADFELLEDGEPREVVAVERLSTDGEISAASGGGPRAAGAGAGAAAGGGWNVVIYFDQPLSSRQGTKKAAEALAEQADRLTALGTVEVVSAAPRPELLLAPSRDAGRLRSVLEKLARKGPSGHDLLQIRREFLRSMNQKDLSDLLSRTSDTNSGPARGGGAAGQAGGGGSPGVGRSDPLRDRAGETARSRVLVRGSVQQEFQLVARQRLFLNDWVSAAGRSVPRALILVSDGFDLRPAEFYLASIEDTRLVSELSAELQAVDSGPANDELMRLLAADGWTVLPVALGGVRSASTLSAAEGGSDHYRSFFQDPGSTSTGQSAFYVGGALEPLLSYADGTGGDLIVDPGQVAEGISDLRDRVLVTYQAPRPPDGRARKVELRALRPGVEARVQRFAAASTTDAAAASRARQVLEAGESPGGDLLVDASLRPQEGEVAEGVVAAKLTARIDLAPIEALTPRLEHASLRVTLGIGLADGRIQVVQQTVGDQDLSQLSVWIYEVVLKYPAGSTGVSLVVDELVTGAWGATAVALPAS